MFIDEVKIKVIAGKGGDGLVSWRREKYIPKGGPRGGNGGNGGNVYLQTNENINTLSEYRHKKILSAEKGEGGGTQDKHGANGEDLILEVPVGTIVKDINTGELIVDLDKSNVKYLIAMGGRGGFGNSHFCSSTRQAPAFAELGDIAEEKELSLELKLVADIGIIGVPSAGKSTLISNITNVKAKIGDYPFTTLTPNLGVLDHKGRSLVLEDVPGLIPGASQGKGLGIEFLKHIERCGVIIHLLDLYRLDQVFEDYKNIRHELEYFSKDLAEKEEIIVFSKADLLDDEMKDYISEEFKKRFNKKDIFTISSASREGVDELIDYLIDTYSKDKTEIEEVELVNEDKLKVYNFKNNEDDPKNVSIDLVEDMTFRASGKRLEQIVRMTDFDNMEAVMRVYNVLDKMGVIRKVEKELNKLAEEGRVTDDFYFEGNDSEDISPKIIVAGREIKLEKLKFNI